MKRKITFISFNLFALFLLAYPTLVRLSAEEGTGGILRNPLKDTTLVGLVNTILSAVIQVGIVVVTFFIIYAGFKYVTARGNTSKLKEAHEGIKWTLIGSAIVLGAYVIRQIVTDTITSLVGS